MLGVDKVLSESPIGHDPSEGLRKSVRVATEVTVLCATWNEFKFCCSCGLVGRTFKKWSLVRGVYNIGNVLEGDYGTSGLPSST